MKFVMRVAILLLICTATFTVAQIQPGTFKHIIIVVQENRTPDNLFGAVPALGAKCGQENQPFDPGADIDNGGYGYVPQSDGTYKYQLICNTPLPLNGWDSSANGGAGTLANPGHEYEDWEDDYRGFEPGVGYTGNLMSGFCHQFDYADWSGACPSYSYVTLTSEVQPYFDIAKTYGFANYMFQSNQGPSMEAHQFLFTGTSAPVDPTGDNCMDGKNNLSCAYDFVGDLLYHSPKPSLVGCPYNNAEGYGWPKWVEPDGTLITDPRIGNPNDPPPSECYTHDSLVTDAADCTNQNDGTDYCDRGVNGQHSTSDWAYYVEPSSPGGNSIWDAPTYIPESCYGQTTQWFLNGTPQSCGLGPQNNSTEWSDHIRVPKGKIPYAPSQKYTWAPIFDDILACQLPAISWVIPDWTYADHPYAGSASDLAIGPSWVGDIIDAVGQSYQNTGKCDYWGYPTQQGVDQEPTAVIVVWDDWGGFFDHVPPWIARQENPHSGYTACDPSTQWGCGYTDGFRVPLLVASPYTPSYVSGACGTGTQNPQCPNPGQNNVYVHDFGSVLKYIEVNFGMQPINQTSPGYADSNAPDSQNGNVPLSDFFPLSPKLGQGRTFTYISTPDDYKCFQNHIKGSKCELDSSWVAGDPDDY